MPPSGTPRQRTTPPGPAAQRPPGPAPQSAPPAPATTGQPTSRGPASAAPRTAPGPAAAATHGLGRAPAAAPTQDLADVADTAAGEESYARATTEQQLEEGDINLVTVLEDMLQYKASDLHLTAGAPPTIRVHGDLMPLEGYEPLTPETIRRVMYLAITNTQRKKFEESLELDFSYSVPKRARFRVNMYQQRDSVGAAFRVIPFEIKPLKELGIPAVVNQFAHLPRGFVVVTGPTGSGKSTTLAALIDEANSKRPAHIMTVEDPIEFLHKHKKSLVNQREVGADTQSFGQALKHVLRQDPDIILVGEMRDLETIQVALTAAETGHLVFATLHTQDAAQTMDRMIDVFPAHQQQEVRQQLAGAIQGVVCQNLCRTTDGKGRVAAVEVMVAVPAIRALIRDGKTHQIYSALQAGGKAGMNTMDQHLAQLVKQGKITYEMGMEKSHHPEDYMRLVGRG